MYLFPTKEEMIQLYRQINPTAQIMDYLCSRPPAEGSMAEFFLESEDDEIEDDIINMRRDINGFKLHISEAKEKDQDIEILKTLPNNQFVSSWDDI